VEGAIMRIEAITIGENPPADVNVLVEVPVGGQPIKYEMDKDAGTLFVDRLLHTPIKIGAWLDAARAREMIANAIARANSQET